MELVYDRALPEGKGVIIPAGWLLGFRLGLPHWASSAWGPDNRKSLKEQAVAETSQHNNRKQS